MATRAPYDPYAFGATPRRSAQMLNLRQADLGRRWVYAQKPKLLGSGPFGLFLFAQFNLIHSY
jgi:hypothetical protein